MDNDINKKLAGEIFAKTGIAIDPDDPAFIIVHLNRLVFDEQKTELADILCSFAANAEKQADKVHTSVDQLSEVYNELDKVHKEIFHKSEEFQQKSADAAAKMAIKRIDIVESDVSQSIANERIEFINESMALIKLRERESMERISAWTVEETEKTKNRMEEVIYTAIGKEINNIKRSANRLAEQMAFINNNRHKQSLLALSVFAIGSLFGGLIIYLVK